MRRVPHPPETVGEQAQRDVHLGAHGREVRRDREVADLDLRGLHRDQALTPLEEDRLRRRQQPEEREVREQGVVRLLTRHLVVDVEVDREADDMHRRLPGRPHEDLLAKCVRGERERVALSVAAARRDEDGRLAHVCAGSVTARSRRHPSVTSTRRSMAVTASFASSSGRAAYSDTQQR